MTYKLIKRITDLSIAIEDWKRNMIDEEQLRQKILECFKALENSEVPSDTGKEKEN